MSYERQTALADHKHYHPYNPTGSVSGCKPCFYVIIYTLSTTEMTQFPSAFKNFTKYNKKKKFFVWGL